jgi:hypothetical protein
MEVGEQREDGLKKAKNKKAENLPARSMQGRAGAILGAKPFSIKWKWPLWPHQSKQLNI